MPRQTKKTEDEMRAKAKEYLDAEKRNQDLLALAITVAMAFIAVCVVFTTATVSAMDAKMDKLSAQQEAIATHVALIETGGVSIPTTSPFCYAYNQQGQKMYGIDDTKVVNKCNVTQ